MMNFLCKALMVAAIGLAAASGPAQADLLIYAQVKNSKGKLVLDNEGCNTTTSDCANNIDNSWNGHDPVGSDGFASTNVGVQGVGILGGNNLIDVSLQLGGPQVNGQTGKFELTETNLAAFTGTLGVSFTGSFHYGTLARTWYLDPKNEGRISGAGVIDLGSFTESGSFGDKTKTILDKISGLTTDYSLTELITFSAQNKNGHVGSVSIDDDTGFAIPVPEPMSLSLLGAGLLGLGAVARRRASRGV